MDLSSGRRPVGQSQEIGDEWYKASPLLNIWLNRVRDNQLQHFDAGSFYDRANTLLGIPTIVLTAIVGTTVFASLQKQVSFKIQIAVGAISVLAAVLAALQTFLRFTERAERHRSAAAHYGAIRRRIEAVGYIPIADRGGPGEFIKTVQTDLDSLASSVPSPPKGIWAALRASKDDRYFLPDWLASKQANAIIASAPHSGSVMLHEAEASVAPQLASTK